MAGRIAAATLEHHVEGLIARCHAGLPPEELGAEVLRRLPGIVPAEAIFLGAVDPATLLFTSGLPQEPLGSVTPQFLDNEYGGRDVNKFAELASARDPVNSLDRATLGDRAGSARYREILAPLGLGDELRAALITGHECWGVLCLHLADAESGFSDRDHAAVRRIAPHLAEGLRHAAVGPGTEIPATSRGPGILILDADMAVVSASPEAEHWLQELGDPACEDVPVPIRAAAVRLAAATADSAEPHQWVRVRTRTGTWLSVHVTALHGPAGTQFGVVLEPASAQEIGSLVLSAHGLTPAQTRVVALVLQGRSTREIVDRLHISANTVQEHLTDVFDRFGVRSRRELIAALAAAHRQ